MAGWISDRRWLAAQGLDTETHLVSAAARSRDDIHVVRNLAGAATDIGAGARRADDRWSEIAHHVDAVAEELGRTGSLSPEALRQALREVAGLDREG